MAGAFRAYDIRGVYPLELDEELAFDVGVAYANFTKNSEAVVASDCRLSSPSLKEAVINGLRAGGLDVTDIGMVPTPVFYFEIVRNNHQGGIIVTGSHNPKEYNGFKLQKRGAMSISAEDGIYEIERMVREGGQGRKSRPTRLFRSDVVPDYIEYVSSKIKLARPLKIIIDCGNGACGGIPERVFKNLGCEVRTIFGEPDGNFPNHVPEPHDPNNMRALQDAVIKEGADLGIAYDGDADRMGVVDERGRIVLGDFLLMALARQALEHRKGDVVFEVRCSSHTFDYARAHGGIAHMEKAGRTYVRNAVIRKNAVFGGELTGHMFFPYCYYNYDDGIFASAKIAEIASNARFSDYVDSMPRGAASPEMFIETTEDRKFAAVEELKLLLQKRGYGFLGIDGARINFSKGWALVRASNTTPHIKCRFEADTNENLDKIIRETEALLNEVGLKLPKR